MEIIAYVQTLILLPLTVIWWAFKINYKKYSGI